MKEKKDRVDDAIKATKAALEEGILPGGGIALLKLYMVNDGEGNAFDLGYKCVFNSLYAPFHNILKNAGVNSGDAYNRLIDEEENFGFNVVTEQYGDMYKMGVIDATKVVRNAIENAVSVSSILLTTEATITNKRA
jgi:chaperonin GroEL